MATQKAEITGSVQNNAVIKVIGVGGGGGNAVEHMLVQNIEGADFICANTDAQALGNSKARVTIQLGEEITKGLGAGANPDIGRESAIADRGRIEAVLAGADMVFITAGMGGGTGTGAAPVVADIAKELGILTVAVVTKPFSFEGRKRMHIAEEGIKALSRSVDSLITIPNNKLLSVLGKDISLLEAFRAANNVLLGAVQGIAELITRPGLINVDFADVRTVMSEMGMAMMGTGVATGENRAQLAAQAAINSPLLEDISLAGARGVLVNITASTNMSIGEFEKVGDMVKGITAEGATVVVGTVIDDKMPEDELRVTLVVTGLGHVTEGEDICAADVVSKTVDMMASESAMHYQQFDRPAVLRKHSSQVTTRMPTSVVHSNHGNASNANTTVSATESVDNEKQDIAYLDIPAFLRRQEEKV